MSNPNPETSMQTPRSRGFARHVLRLVIIVLAILAVVLVSKIPKRQTDVGETEPQPVNVTVMQITSEPEVEDSFDLPAVVEPNRVTTVSTEISGRIETIACKKGQKVQATDVLATLNSDLLIPQYDTAKAQHERDKLEWERMQDLVRKKATAQKDLDDATTKLEIGMASIHRIRATIDRCRIVAPAHGIINDLSVEVGEYLDPGVPVAQLVDTTTVKVAVGLPEKDVPFFSVGQSAQVIASVRGIEEVFTGTITFISEVADLETRSTRMEITLPNPEHFLYSGQIVRVRLTRQILRNAIFIPLLAVIPLENGKAVYVVEDGLAVRREVKLGAIQDDRIQIRQGLKDADQLIIEGHRFVAPGLKVTIIPKKP